LCIVQDHNHNTGIWSNIESATRYLAKKEGSLYIITGPIYKGTLKSIGNGVLVPTYIYKIIYSPKQQKAAVYFTNNESGKAYHVISVKELEILSGINFFPKMKEKLLCITPFENEEEVITIQELTLENRLDRVSIYGSVDITKDQQGLEYAFALKRQIDTIVEYLKKQALPEKISVENVAKEVENPF